jgi:hypothetical protein
LLKDKNGYQKVGSQLPASAGASHFVESGVLLENPSRFHLSGTRSDLKAEKSYE